jgi:hypothetical protein
MDDLPVRGQRALGDAAAPGWWAPGEARGGRRVGSDGGAVGWTVQSAAIASATQPPQEVGLESTAVEVRIVGVGAGEPHRTCAPARTHGRTMTRAAATIAATGISHHVRQIAVAVNPPVAAASHGGQWRP